MNSGYENFTSQTDEAIANFPTLRKEIIEEQPMLKGILPIIDIFGKKWDEYEVEIRANKYFPYLFPDVYETSGKIPKIGDWHINEDTLSCCLTVLPEEIIRCKNGIRLVAFIKDEVLPYFFNQTHRRVEGYYVNGEYGHGTKGLLEYYSDILLTEGEAETTATLLHFIATRNKPNRTSICFCGSGQKYRHCHKKAYEKLKLVGDAILQLHAKTIWESYVA